MILVARHGVHVGDVAVGHAADLDAERIGQHQLREAPRVAHRHLGGDPAAEAGADQDRLLQLRASQRDRDRDRRGRRPCSANPAAPSCPSPDDAARSRGSAAPADRATRGCGSSPSPGCRNSSGGPSPRSSSSNATPATLIDRVMHPVCAPDRRGSSLGPAHTQGGEPSCKWDDPFHWLGSARVRAWCGTLNDKRPALLWGRRRSPPPRPKSLTEGSPPRRYIDKIQVRGFLRCFGLPISQFAARSSAAFPR